MAETSHPVVPCTFWVMSRAKAPRQARKKEDEAASEPPALDPVVDYEKAIKKVASFSTAEEFWQVYGHMTHPTESAIDYHLFRAGVKPVWEDPANRRGGKLVIKCRKGLGARYFEAAMLAMIGEQFGELGDDVMGIVLSVRNQEDALAVWTRNADDHDATEKIRDVLKKTTRVPAFVPIDFKRHEINDRTSGAAQPPVWRQRRPHESDRPAGNPAEGGGSWR
jgi:translation initiation factor 4E